MSASSVHQTTPSTAGTTAEGNMPQLLAIFSNTSDQDWNNLSRRAASRAGKKPIPISDHIPVLPAHRKRGVTDLRASFNSLFREYFIFWEREQQDALELAKDMLSSRIEHYILTMFCIEDLADYKKGVSDLKKEIGTILGKNPVCQEHGVLLGLLAPVLSKIAAIAEVPAPLDVPSPTATLAPASTGTRPAPMALQGPEPSSLPSVPSYIAPSPQQRNSTQSSPTPKDEKLKPRQGDWNYLDCIPFELRDKVLSAFHEQVKTMWDQVKLTSHVQHRCHDLYELTHLMDYNTLKAVHPKAQKENVTPTASQIETEYEMLAEKKWYEYGIVETFLKKIKIFSGYLKKVASWAKMKLGYTSYACKIVTFEEVEMSDIVEWAPKPLNTRPHILSSLIDEIGRMHNKACNELNHGVSVLRADQIRDMGCKLEEKLYNDLNAELKQNPMGELAAWQEYSLRANRMLGSLSDMDTFVATVDRYLVMYP